MKTLRSLFFLFLLAAAAGVMLPGLFVSEATATPGCIESNCTGTCTNLLHPIYSAPCDCHDQYGCSGATRQPYFVAYQVCDGTFCWQVFGCFEDCEEL